MKKCAFFSVLLPLLAISGLAMAQLPANPWAVNAPHPNDGYFGDNLPQQALPNVPNAPAYNNGATGGDVLPVDPWARARDRSGIQTWRGSGNHGRLNYVGEATTFMDAQGQEMIAPEVNRHNMLVGVEHLRSLGYKIPDSYNDNIKNMPQNYAKHLREAYDGLGSQNNPFDTIGSGMRNAFENFTGLDMENLMFNSVDLLSTD